MKSATLLTTFAALSIGFGVEASVLNPYEAHYRARAMGLSTTAYRSLTLVGEQTYRLENSLTLTVLGARVGTVVETSEFTWNDETLTPLVYHYNQTGVSAREEKVTFDWQAGSAFSQLDSESWTLPLQHGVMDKLSYSLMMGKAISSSTEQEFSFDIIDADEVDAHVYRITGEEVITTPAGNLNTVRIERVRRPDSRRSTVIWLARDWDYLLIRLEQVSGSGTRTELALESATIAGEPLKGE